MILGGSWVSTGDEASLWARFHFRPHFFDLSRAFIDAADTLRRDGELRYFRKDEGRLGVTPNAMVDPALDRSRVSFRQADACGLPAELVDFDAVLLANLLCRLPNPKALLGRLGGPRGLVKPGGLLAIFSPYSWLEAFTPPEAWLGGYERDGQPVRTATALGEFLRAEGFELLREADEPLVIRDHARKYQYIVAHATLWRLKSEEEKPGTPSPAGGRGRG
jgi:putative 4-mercaptohistidine N1-methyltranferase